jgi:hypothetical protein
MTVLSWYRSRKMNRTQYLQPEVSEREHLLSEAGTGDLELTDIFNRATGQRRSSPLRIEDLREAVKLSVIAKAYERRPVR